MGIFAFISYCKNQKCDDENKYSKKVRLINAKMPIVLRKPNAKKNRT